jgi:hypothetical protein
MPAEAGAYCRESLIRLKPGLPFSDVRIKNSNFIKPPIRNSLISNYLHSTPTFQVTETRVCYSKGKFNNPCEVNYAS